MTPTPNPTAEQVQKIREAIFAQSQRERDQARGSGLYYPSIEAAETIIQAAGLISEGAPSAERGTRSKYISPSLPGMIRNLWKDDPSENSVRTALKLAGDLIQELIDLRVAEGAPSEEQIERARVEIENITQAAQKSLCGSEPDHAGIYESAERALAALDGAPEPEVKP